MPTESPVNGVSTTLAYELTSGATSCVLTDASEFPNAQYHVLLTDGINYEIALGTSVSGSTLYLTRAVEPYNGIQSAFTFGGGVTEVTIVPSVGSIAAMIAQAMPGGGSSGAVAPVKVVSAFETDMTNSPPSGAATIDGYSVTTGDRVLLAAQTNPIDMGVWIANTAGVWTRPTDWFTGNLIPDGTIIPVAGTYGAYLYASIWQLEGDDTVGTSSPDIELLAGYTFAFPNYHAGANPDFIIPGLLRIGGGNTSLFYNSGNPNGVVSALSVGDVCFDSLTPGIWQASATGYSSWVQLGSGGSGLPANFLTGAGDPNTANVAGTDGYFYIDTSPSHTGMWVWVDSGGTQDWMPMFSNGNNITSTPHAGAIIFAQGLNSYLLHLFGNQGVSFGLDPSTTYAELLTDGFNLNVVFYPEQQPTSSAPYYSGPGGVYFDTTLNKLRIGGASGWETVTSV